MFLTPVTFSRDRMSERQLERKNKKILEIRPPNNFHFPVTALFKQQLAEAQLRERKRRLLLSTGRARDPSVGPGTASELADGSLGTGFGNHVLRSALHVAIWKPQLRVR